MRFIYPVLILQIFHASTVKDQGNWHLQVATQDFLFHVKFLDLWYQIVGPVTNQGTYLLSSSSESFVLSHMCFLKYKVPTSHARMEI